MASPLPWRVVARAKTAEPISIASPASEKGPALQLYVIFTNLEATNGALKTASHLAHSLNTRLVLLVPKVVPYPLPLENPPVSGEFTERLLSQLASEQEAETTVRVYLCRDRDATIREALGPESLVVIGSQRRWWLNKEQMLARRLRRDGHDVILVDLSADRDRVQ